MTHGQPAMQVGVKLPTSGPLARPDVIERVVREVEALGFDSVWVNDHVHRTPEDARHHFVAGTIEAWREPVVPNVYEALTTLSFAAGLTSRVTLGTSILVLPLRNPVWLAKALATLDQLSRGRLIVGVGQGGPNYVNDELGAVGASYPASSIPEVTEESIGILRAVWREPIVDHEGPAFRVRGASVFPKPLRETIPIWHGGQTRAARVRAGQLCDGWLPMFLLPSELRAGMADVRGHAQRVGRAPDALRCGSEHWLAIDQRGSRAHTKAKATLSAMAEATAAGWPDPGVRLRANLARIDEANLLGDPSEIRERLDAYHEAGVDHLVLRVIASDEDDFLRSLRLFRAAAWPAASRS